MKLLRFICIIFLIFNFGIANAIDKNLQTKITKNLRLNNTEGNLIIIKGV